MAKRKTDYLRGLSRAAYNAARVLLKLIVVVRVEIGRVFVADTAYIAVYDAVFDIFLAYRADVVVFNNRVDFAQLFVNALIFIGAADF